MNERVSHAAEIARCPDAPSTQELLRRDEDAKRQPPHYTSESYKFLGDEDLPFARYTSAEFFKAEMEHMWTRTWQWACRVDHIPTPGSYYVYDIGRHSIVIVRNKDMEIKAYVNACLHRSTKLKPSFSKGSSPRLTCPFHGWSWTLDGKLAALPCSWDFPHVSKEELQLPEVRVDTWGGFVWINLDENAVPLLDYLAPLPEHARNAGFEDRYVALHMEKELNCNWKVAVEAFLEAYHLAATHPQLLIANSDINSQYDVYSDTVSRLYNPNGVASPRLKRDISQQEMLDGMILGDRKGLKSKLEVPEGSTARRVMADYFKDIIAQSGKDVSSLTIAETIDTVGYFVFPNGQFFLAPAFPQIHRIRPIGNDCSRTLFETLMLPPLPEGGTRPPPAEPFRIKAEESYQIVPGVDPTFAHAFDQDTGNVAWMQEGMNASRKKAAKLANYQEVRIRNLHRALDNYLPDEVVRFAQETV